MATPIRPVSGSTPEHDLIENWDEYWLTGAWWASRKSKDPKCQVGALIVNDGVLVSSGFNGLARNVFDDPHVLNDADEKIKWICHAEMNAILNAARQGVSLKGATIYVTKFPCLGCCNAIIQAGVTRIYTHDTKYWSDDPADKDHSRKKSLLRQSKIDVDAPFHPDFAPKRITGKPSMPLPKPVPANEERDPRSSVVELTAATGKRKGAKAARPRKSESKTPELDLFGKKQTSSRSGDT